MSPLNPLKPMGKHEWRSSGLNNKTRSLCDMAQIKFACDVWIKSKNPLIDTLKLLYTGIFGDYGGSFRPFLAKDVEILIALEFEAIQKVPLSGYSDQVIGDEIAREDLAAFLKNIVLPDIQNTYGYQLIRENWLRYKIYDQCRLAPQSGLNEYGHVKEQDGRVKKQVHPQKPFPISAIDSWIAEGDAGIDMTPDARARLTLYIVNHALKPFDLAFSYNSVRAVIYDEERRHHDIKHIHQSTHSQPMKNAIKALASQHLSVGAKGIDEERQHHTNHPLTHLNHTHDKKITIEDHRQIEHLAQSHEKPHA